MERHVQLDHAGEIAGTCRRRHALDHASHLVEIGFHELPESVAVRELLDRRADGDEHVENLVAPDLDDDSAAVRKGRDEAFLLELAESFADRAATHPELLGQLLLEQAFTGDGVPVNDRTAECLRDLLAERSILAGDRLQVRESSNLWGPNASERRLSTISNPRYS